MLKYFFTVQFKDGSTYEQRTDDVSLIDGSRSSFYDVQQHTSSPHLFVLRDENNAFGVNLENGVFAVNGVSFKLYDGEITSPLRLIYFRRHYHEFNQELQEMGHKIHYHFGWQTTINGENVQRVMEVE